MNQSTYGKRLAWLRTVGRVPVAALKDLAGVSKSYASVVARGHDDLSPTMATARSLADCFGVEVNWLVFGDGQAPSAKAIRARMARKMREQKIRPLRDEAA